MSDITDRLRSMVGYTLADCLVGAHAADEIDRLRAEVAILQTWKQAIVDGLTVANVYHPLHETDAKTALNALVGGETMVALDPRVSKDAAALIERGREEMRAENAELRGRYSLASARVDALWRTNEQVRAQIAAHEKICAGVWVKVTERLPKLGDVVDCKNAAGEFMKNVTFTTRGWGIDSRLSGFYFLLDMDAPVEWLDARMPGEETP